MPVLLDIPEAGRLLRASPSTVRQWWLKGLLPGVRIGRQIRFTEETIARIAAEGLDLNSAVAPKDGR